MKRFLAYLLCFSMVVSLFGPTALAAGSGEMHTQRAHDCRDGAGETVTSFSALKTAVETGSGEIDLILRTGGDWTATSTVSIPAGKTVHLRAAAGETVTLKRGSSFLNGPLFDLAAGGRLILGSGRVEYTGDTLQKAAQQGDYTVYQDWDAGELILDGGAVWGSPEDWTPGANFGDNTGKTAVLYSEDGVQYKYTNSGNTSTRPLVVSKGTVELWNGAALKNNAMTDDGNALSKAGSAINSSGDGSVLNMYGGEISGCVVATDSGDTGRGAVFTGNFVPGNWNTKVEPINAHFNMYGGRITRNAASGSGNQDGGGVSVETGYMDLYGGEVSYNHAGVWFEASNKASGDGGGLMVRNYAQFNMWGGSVDHNFAGGSGGGVVAWNAQVYIKGGEITENKAAYGGGLAISSSNDNNSAVSATTTMEGGLIASNEAINTTTASTNRAKAGVGGGICVGAGGRTQGSTLILTGGEIRQNTAANGGGMGIYAGGGQNEGSIRNTSVDMSGSFQLTNNFADRNGNGMYISNEASDDGSPGNKHYLVKLSGGARIDTNNPVYFANLCSGQVPVLVKDILTSEGTAAIFEFADSFWNNSAGSGYIGVKNAGKIVNFAKDVQENKIALESANWYFKMDNDGSLVLQDLTENPQYTIRNGAPIQVDGAVYYRIYASLSDAFAEAADGDTLYIYYNTTVGVPAVLEGKHVTLMAESTSSAGRDAGLSGSGREKSCWLETSEYGYHVMRGNFLKYVGGTAGDHAVSGSTATKGSGPYRLETDPDGGTAYNVRNDYTITLSGRLYLGESVKGNGAGEGAVVVKAGASLAVGQTATAGMGAGALTFDGNRSAPKEGPMFQTAGTLALHSGVTVKNHSNYSMAHPGAVEVKGGGSLVMDEGVTLSGNVSPVAGAVYVAQNGSFTMNGGDLTGNDGAMPRYGFLNTEGARLTSYDTAYWGQGKYYSGAGAVYNLGAFTMKGGSITGNRGEYGALANLGGTMDLQKGTVSGNHAQTGTGEGEHSLSITGYTEGASPAIPGSSQWASSAGSGGGIYQGGGTATVGSGVTVSGNTAQNGGGVAVGKGRDLTRTVSGYTNVPNGREYITSAAGSIAAKVPQYGAAAAAGTAPVALTVKAGAALTENRAEKLGGGVYVTGNGDSAALESGVILRRNEAWLAGGGLAAFQGGSVAFDNEVTENTAVYGGGVYVGGGSAVTAKGNFTANQADSSGGGAYVDSGDILPVGPGPVGDAEQAGRLILDGALVNNNRLNDPRGFGVGVYNRGDLILTAAGGGQPTVSYNDRIYLEAGRVVTLAESYDITASGQNVNNRLTLESRETENGTAILKAANTAQASATLTSGFITHYTHPIAQNQTDKTVLELNSVPVVYYDRFTAAGGLGSHYVEVPYASGDNVIFQNFAVGQDYDFEAPSGMSFLRWVTINDQGKYLDSDGNVVDSPDKAHTYFAGNTVVGIQKPVYLEAVYGTVSYSALLQVLDEKGNVISDHDDYMGEITLGGATYNSATGEYTFAMGTPMNVTPVPSSSKGKQTVLQGLEIYEKVSQQITIDDISYNGSFWTPVAQAEMEQEELNVPGGGPKTVTATGKMTGVTAKSGVDAKLDSEGRFAYTASDTDILVRARFKWAMVRLDIEEKDGSAPYTGYYDNMHEAITAIAKRIDRIRVNDETHTVTLLAPNSVDENGNDVVLYYGEAGKDPAKCVDNDIVAELREGETLHAVYDLGGYILDYQHFGERNLKKYDMTIRNGSILYHGSTDKIYDPENDPDGRGPLPAAFRVAEGTLTLENVTIRTTGTPQGGHNDEVYSAKVMEEGTLNIGRGCTLGDVFIYTDRDDIQNATPEQPSERSGHVTVTNTFVEGRTDLVATLCLRYWTFDNQIRRVIVLDESVAAREGVSIRRMFSLKDVDGDGTDHAQYWFIGTDGRLYKKAAFLLPWLEANSRMPVQDPLTRYWDYADKQGKWEIGDRSPDHAAHTVDGEPSWTGGYPFYYGYYSTYGFDADTAASIHAQLKDAEGNDLEIDRGTVAFTVSQITIDPGKASFTDRRNFSGTTGLTATGSASLNFPALSEMPVSETLNLKDWTAPNDYYVINATWAGAGQYAPQYADYWNYARAVTRETEDHSGVTGNTIAGSLRLSVQGKNLTDPSVEVAAITPRSAEYIGQKGFEDGYTSGPTVGRVVDNGLDRAMVPGTDYNIYFAALTPVTEDPAAGTVVVDENGAPLVCEYTREGTPQYFHYIAGENNTKVYYTTGGEGTKDGMTPANAKDINGAPAGSYSVALEAETLDDPNYVGQSGWKNTLFTIKPYNGALSISGPNHIVVAEGENYAQNITNAFTGGRAAVTVSDRYGNLLDLADCAFTFAPISGSAKLDANGWPTAEGLYNLVVTATGHQNGTMKLPDVGVRQDGGSDPNYAHSAAGYLAILITHKQLDVFFVPQVISAPYTGTIYTSDMVKDIDRDDYLTAGGYQVWKTVVNDRGEPLDEAGNVITVTDIPTRGGERSRLPSTQYRVEIGSPQHTPRDVGDYTMVVTDISGSYIGIGTLHITSETLGDIHLSAAEGVYTGVNHTPQVTVTDSRGKVLTLNRDYVIRLTDENGRVVSSPINAGTYTYTAVGINNYVAGETETVSATYTVKPKDLNNSDANLTAGIRGVILDAPTYAITGANNLVISYALYYNGMTLTRGENADYDHVITKDGVVTAATREPGTYLFTIQGKGNYTGKTTFSLVVVQQSDSGLSITNTQEYTYNGGNFESYNWQLSAAVNWISDGVSTRSLDPYQFDVALLELMDNGTFSPVDATQPLDAGLYQLILTPKEDYAVTEGLPSDLRGNCIFRIRRLPVTITLTGGSKTYGEQDPDFAGQGYRTNLIGAEENGFYAHDADRMIGQFGRNTGEDVRNSGYRYTLGDFDAGDNYVLTVSVETVFRIEPKDISIPGAGGGEDLIRVERREAMSYTGYGLEPIQSVTYSAPRGQLAVAEQSGYLPTYERWNSGQPGCVPGCELEGCVHGWETMSATPTDVAWYRVTLDADDCVTAPDNYVGSRSYLFEIKAQGGDLELDVEGEDAVTYDRGDHAPVVTVKREGFVLAKEYYTLSYSFAPADGSAVQTGSFISGETKFRDAGVYTIYAAGSGNYVGSGGKAVFTVKPKSLADGDTQDGTEPVDLAIAPGQTFTYHGSRPQQAKITASYLEEAVGEGDYTLSYQNHMNAGTATVTVTGQGNYTGSRTLTYTIGRQPLLVEVGNAVKVYGSADPAYEYTVKDTGGTAVAGIRLTGAAGRAAGEDVGNYDLDIGTLSAGSNYELSLSGAPKLTIIAKSIGDGTSPAGNISAQAPGYVTAEGADVNGLKTLPSVTYWAPALGKQALTPEDHYTVSVTDQGGAVLDGGAALREGETYTLTVTARAEGNYTGSFSLKVTTVDADSLISLGAGSDLTRYYRPVAQEVTLTPAAKGTVLQNCDITVAANYNAGNSQVMRPVQKADGSFTFSLTDAGTYTVVATKSEGDSKMYFGTVTYVVQPKDISEGNTLGGGEASLNEPEGDFSYTGREVYPTNANALLEYDGRTVPASEGGVTNYIVGYSGNVNPGTATVTVYGQGNYSGSRTTTFTVGEIRYHVRYYANGALTGTVPMDDGLYMKNSMATVMGNVGGLTGPRDSGKDTIFLGWSDVQLGVIRNGEDLTGELYVSGSIYQVGEGDVNLYAVWAADANQNGIADCDEDKYTVTYCYASGDECTGSVPVDAKHYLSGMAVQVLGNIAPLALDGYLLLGWSPMTGEPETLKLENSDAFFNFVSGNALYTGGRSFSMGSEDLKLYAVWGADANKNGTVDWMESKVQYFVSYDGNGGAGTLPRSHALTAETLTVTVAPGFDAAALKRPGHVLLGWTATQEQPLTEAPEEGSYLSSGDPYVIKAGDPNPVVFYALWAVDENGNGAPDYGEDRYTLTFANACGEVTVTAMPGPVSGLLEGTAVKLPEEDAAKGTTAEGRAVVFLGWTTAPEEAGEVYARGTTPENMLAPGAVCPMEGDATLYSVWGEPDYHIARYEITVTPTPAEGGEVKTEGDKTAVLSGEDLTVTVTVKPGYALSQILVNGVAEPLPEPADETGRTFRLELKDIRENKSVVVAFARSEFRVVWPNPATFDATRQAPTLKVYKSDDTGTTVAAADYTLSGTFGTEGADYGDLFTHAGTYTVTVEGKAGTQYAGSKVQVPYVIHPAALTAVTLKEGERPYKGTVYADEIAEVKAGELTVPAVTESNANGYTALYSANLNVGTATVVVTGAGDYTGAVSAQFEIAAAGADSLKAAWGEEPSLTYNGQPQKPAPTVTNSAGDVLTENLDYTLAYPGDTASAGEKTVTVTGTGNFDGAAFTLAYTIKKKALTEGDKADGTAPVTALAFADQTYTGSALEPVPTLLYGAAPALTLVKDTDFTLSYSGNTAVGTASVTVTGKGNYAGSRELTFEIVPAGSGLTAAVSAARTYNGAGQLLSGTELAVKQGTTELTLGTDYDVTYTAMTDTGAKVDADGAPKNAGTYAVTITAKGSYSGTARTTLTIAPAKVTELTVDETGFTYDGEPHVPNLRSVKAGTLTLAETDYTVTYQTAGGAAAAAPTQAGSYILVVTGQGNFTGTKKVNFTISKGTLLTVAGTVSDRAYDGLPYQPTPQIKAGNRTLTENVDYILTYPDDTVNAGEKTVTVTGKGNYEGAEATFTYAVTAVSLTDEETVLVSVPDQVYTGAALTPGVVVTHHTADGRILFLTKGEDADFTVEYSDNLNAGTASVTVKAVEGGNYEGERAASFQITSAGGKNLSVTVDPASLTYNGKAQEAAVTVKDGDAVLAAGTDYTVAYRAVTGTLDDSKKPLGAGSYDVAVSGKGNYEGDVGTASLVILPAALGEVTVAADGLTYDGEAKEPAVTVKNAAGAALTPDTDYTVTYGSNTGAGTATVTVAGKGNYAGTVVKTFSIAKAELVITPTTLEKVYGEADSLTYTAAARADYAFEGALTRAAGENVGEYDFDLSTLREQSGNYTLVLDESAQTFEITKQSLSSDAIIQAGDLTVGYTGQPFAQAIRTFYTASMGELVLSGGDYTVTYDGSETAPTAAGTYEVTVTATEDGNYSGSYTFTLTISDAVLGVTLDGDTVTYSGADYGEDMLDRLSASFNSGAVTLTAEDVTFRDASGASVDEIVNAGAYTVVVKAADYEAVELPFLVQPKDISEVTAEDPADAVYDGTAKEPAVTLTDGGAALTEGDYTLSYQNNTQAGTARAVVTGTGNYTGTKTLTFTIEKKTLAEADVGSLNDVVFNGAAQLQKPEADGMTEGRDYVLSYSGGTNVGSVTVTVTGQGNYRGTVERSYAITPKPLQTGWLTVTPGQVTYTGAPQEPLVLVTDGSTRLIRGTDYELRYENNVDIGSAAAKVTGKGNYEGEISKSFTISANAASLAVSLDKTEAAYTGENVAPTLSVTSGGAAVAAYTAAYTFNGADKGAFDATTALVDVGVYTITVTGTENYAGATGSVTFAIRPGTFQVDPIGEQDYTGGPVTPLPVVTREGDGEELVRGTDYLLSYANNVAVGENTATVTVTGLGNYAGAARTVRFTITGANTLFHVTYDGNGHSAGELPTDSRDYLSGDTATVLDGARLARLGAVFLGWSADRQPLVTTRAAEAALNLLRPGQSLTVGADTTLYAVWAADSDHSGRPDYAEQVVVTASAGEGGSIVPGGKRTVAWGEKRLEYTITVNSGYTFSNLTVDGIAVPVSKPDAPTALTKGENGTYTYVFTDVKEDHVILATFRQNGGGGGGGGGGTTVVVTPPEEKEPDTGVENWLVMEPHGAYLEGRGGGLFGPNDQMTRAEAATMFYRLLKEKDVPAATRFEDVPEDAWYSKAVYAMTSAGLLKGVGEDRFEPDRPITRAEFAVLISRMATQAETGQVRAYTDISPEDWFYENVQLVSYYGWMAGYPDGSFGPGRNISRGEAAKVINAMTLRRPDKAAIDRGMGVRFDDVAENHWAFYEIVEAATAHDHSRTGGKENWKTP